MRAFSPAWRERYESELLAVLAEEDRPSWAQCLDLLGAGARQRGDSLRRAVGPRAVGVLASAALAAIAIIAVAVAVVPGALAPHTPRPAAARRSAPPATVTVGPSVAPSSSTALAGHAAAVVVSERSRGRGRQRAIRVQRGTVRTVRLQIAGHASERATGWILGHGASS